MMRFAVSVLVGCMTTLSANEYASQGTGTGARPSPVPIAIVSSLDGRAVVQKRGLEAEDLEIFQWLEAGTSIVVQLHSQVTLLFANGTRVQCGSAATATLGAEGLSMSSGPIKSLTSLPALPNVSPIARSVHPPPGAAAIRVRGPRIERLLPSPGEVSLADRTVLQFHAIGGPAVFSVKVEDQEGAIVFHAETVSSPVPIPAGVLVPGSHYHWTVVARTAIGQTFRNSAEFTTLATRDQEARAQFRAGLIGSTDARTLALLAEIDRGLNMMTEARDGLLAALALSPHDAAIRAALRRVEQQLGNP